MQLSDTLVSAAVPAVMISAVVAMVGYANWRDAGRERDRVTLELPLGTRGAPRTTREDLERRVAEMESRLAERPDDGGAAVLLADALLRQTRIAGNPGLAVRAEEALRRALREDPGDYEARRMLATVFLSQHRFREGIEAARQARDQRPDDAWNYGVMGDGYLELGEYDRAFEAFQRMMDLRPSAAAYARASYALELQGDRDAALDTMKLAAGATSARDPESQAWHQAQIGDLFLKQGDLAAARRHYELAAALFPNHPFAVSGLARLRAAEGDLAGALELYRAQWEETPTPEVAVAIGDLHARLGSEAEAERYYALAEAGWRFDSPEPAALARFLAERDRKPGDAVKLAEGAAAERRDIFTDDALAWAYFKAGRLDAAREASRRALRTGTRDRAILYHAAAIAKAAGDHGEARRLVEMALDGHPEFDLVNAPQANALRESLEHDGRLAKR